jgi:hypothetical protein
MQLIQAKEPESKYSYGAPEALGEYDVKRLEEEGVELAAYYYASGSYEGSGSIIFRTKDGWRYHNMGHCSCYGPLDNGWAGGKAEKTLYDLVGTFSDELKRETKPLIDALCATVSTDKVKFGLANAVN